MTFSSIKGNEEVRKAFAGMISSGRIPHAIMLCEDDGGGGVSLATAFLQMLFCSSPSGEDSCGECPSCGKVGKLIHPDVHYVFPVISGKLSGSYAAQWRKLVLENMYFTEADLYSALDIEKKSSVIAVPEAKNLLETLSLSALEGGYRAVVIYLPEKLNQEASNRLLKLIEEPPEKTQFLLVTHAPEKVLPTISSRCQRIRVMPCGGVSTTLPADFPQFAALMDALVSRDLLKALEAGEAMASLPSRENVKGFCKFAGERLREMFLIQQGMESACNPSEDVKRWAARCRKTFPRIAMEAFNRVAALTDRNVSLKIMFTELVDRLFVSI